MKNNCIFDESNKKMLSKMNQIKMTFKIKEIEIVKFYKTEKGANGFESLIRKNFKLINLKKTRLPYFFKTEYLQAE